uniref:Protein U26 n=1 Tax=Human betaherpesvirus 6 TaxID=10368 RepID=A0A1W6DB54_9BETA|nr:U26 [Human betaherpesvirus 6]
MRRLTDSFILGLAKGAVIPGLYPFRMTEGRSSLEQIGVVITVAISFLLTFKKFDPRFYKPIGDFKIVFLSLMAAKLPSFLSAVVMICLIFSEMRLRMILSRCVLIMPCYSPAVFTGMMVSLFFKSQMFDDYSVLTTTAFLLPFTLRYGWMIRSSGFLISLQKYRPILKSTSFREVDLKYLVKFTVEFLLLFTILWIGKIFLSMPKSNHLFFLTVVNNVFFKLNVFKAAACAMVAILSGLMMNVCLYRIIFEAFLGLGFSSIMLTLSSDLKDRSFYAGDLLNGFFCLVVCCMYFGV